MKIRFKIVKNKRWAYNEITNSSKIDYSLKNNYIKMKFIDFGMDFDEKRWEIGEK